MFQIAVKVFMHQMLQKYTKNRANKRSESRKKQSFTYHMHRVLYLYDFWSHPQLLGGLQEEQRNFKITIFIVVRKKA